MREDIRAKIKQIAAEVLHTAVDDDTTQKTCDAWDSMHHLSMIIELETAFDVSLEPEEIALMKSITAIEETLRSKL